MGDYSNYPAGEVDRVAERLASDPKMATLVGKIFENDIGMAIYPRTFTTGMAFDIEHFLSEKLPFGDVKAPTLICHGKIDAGIDFQQAEQAHAGIAGSELHAVENGTHIIAFDPTHP